MTEVVLAIGVFDGLHIGHHYLLEETITDARARRLPSMVVTFDRDPEELFAPPHTLRKLLSDQERLQMLAASGIDELVVLRFDQELAALSPEDFLNQVLALRCQPRSIHVGSDFRFGASQQGNVETLKHWADKHDVDIYGHHLLDDDRLPVSATRIRAALDEGKVEEAARLLGRPYHVRGTIVHGRGMGEELGFPTANVVLDGTVMRPADGVYACRATIEKASENPLVLAAAVSVGIPKTFADAPDSIEANLLDFSGDVYDCAIKLEFIAWLRPMRAFASEAELITAIALAVEQTRELVELT